MTPIEIIALIFAIAVLVKVVVILIHPKKWMGFAEKLTGNKKLFSAIYLLLAIIVGYYVFAAMSIVNIVAAMLFGILLISISMIPHIEPILKAHKKMSASQMFRTHWPAFIIWIALALWVLYTLLL